METDRVLRKGKSGEGVKGTALSTCSDKRKQQRTSKQEPSINLEEEDNCRPVKIETSVCDAEGTNLIHHLQINLLSHCILCLRKTTSSRSAPPPSMSQKDAESSETIRVVPRADLSISSAVPLTCFNFIWAHFGKKNKAAAEAEGLFSVESESGNQNKSTVFLEHPTMCISCAEKMEAVHKLVQELRTQLGVLERVKLESKHGEKYSWRAEQFQRALRRSNLDKGVIEATHQILDIVLEDKMDGGQRDLMATNQSRIPGNTSSLPLREGIPLPEKELEDLQTKHAEEIDSDGDDGGYSGGDQDNWSDIEPDNIKSEPEEEDDFSQGEEESLTGNPEITTRTISIDQRRFFSEPVSSTSSKLNSASKSRKKITSTKSTVPTHTSNGHEKEPNPKIDLSGSDIREEETETVTVQRKRGRQKSNKRPECDICGKLFARLVNLRQHKKQTACSKDGNLQKQMCDLCKVYVPLTDIYTHIREHIGEEYLIKCPNPECPRVYSSSRYLYRHLKTGKGACRQFAPPLHEFLELTKTCQLCGHKAATASSIRGHLSQMHETPTKNFSCPIESCPQRFTVRQSVVCHIYQHDMRRAFEKQKCDRCRKMIKLEKMEGHLKEAHQVDQVVKCKRCPFIYSSWQLLLDHLFVHRHGDLTCDICEDDNFKYYRIQHLRKHYLSAHGIGTQYPCRDCDRACWTQEELTEHAKRQHGRKRDGSLMEALPKKRVKIIKCDACDASFIAERYLRSHKIKEHGAEPWGCKLCTETFVDLNHLWIHEREHKAGSRTFFKCDREGCGKGFRSNKGLQLHISSFHLQQRHVCELCGKSYAGETGLAQHKIRAHSGRSPAHVCEVCGESFMGTGHLRRHKLIHSGERPFGCQICGQRFRQRNVLATHLKSHRRKGADFKPKGPMKHIRKRVEKKQTTGN